MKIFGFSNNNLTLIFKIHAGSWYEATINIFVLPVWHSCWKHSGWTYDVGDRFAVFDMFIVLNFILSYHLLKFPARCGLFMMNENAFQINTWLWTWKASTEMTETMEDWKSASELLLLTYVRILWTWLPEKWCQVSDMLPGLKMELWISIFFFALTLIFVTWMLNMNLLKNMPPCHSVWGFWTGPLAKNGAYHWFNPIFTECSTCSDSLFT